MASPEEKSAPSEEGKVEKVDEAVKAPEKKEEVDKEVSKDLKDSAPAKSKVKEVKNELEREYIIPLRREVLKTKKYRRAKRAVRTIKEFLARHMKVEERDLKKVKINIHLNNEIWFRGIKKPANKIKVKAVKRDGIVYAELAEIPEVTQYKISREIKRAANIKTVKKPKAATEDVPEADVNKDGVEDKTEKKEKAKSEAEKDAKIEKAAAKTQKHTASGKHAAKTMPQRKVLK